MKLPVLLNTPTLLPTQLSEVTQRAVEDLLREGESHNTQTSYRSALKYWAAWYGMRYGQQIQLPVPAACVLQFIVDHADRTTAKGLAHELPVEIDKALVDAGYKGKLGAMAQSTLVHRIAVLSKAHQMREVKNPCQDPKVRELLSRTRKAHAKRGALPRKKDALTKDPLQALLDTCDDSLRGKRDLALLLFAWATGGRRRSEVALAEVRHLKRLSKAGSPPSYSYTLGVSKTNQFGTESPDNEKPVLGAAAEALAEWLAASGITEGRIFRRIRAGGAIGESLSAAALRDIVKERSALAGIEGDFSAHSLRSGFVTEASHQRIPLAETMAMTGHRSVATVIGYSRTNFEGKAQAGKLFDVKPPTPDSSTT